MHFDVIPSGIFNLDIHGSPLASRISLEIPTVDSRGRSVGLMLSSVTEIASHNLRASIDRTLSLIVPAWERRTIGFSMMVDCDIVLDVIYLLHHTFDGR